MGFRLAPKSMTLDDLELDGGSIQYTDKIFGSSVGFSGSADLMAHLSSVKNPRWRLTAILDIQK